ncbi:hypothetical protein CLOP_g21373 [Closterium sp. NIES-67]|nr:hypothetical protein CLOP_g21373 [Closterium sp. NIES-67]
MGQASPPSHRFFTILFTSATSPLVSLPSACSSRKSETSSVSWSMVSYMRPIMPFAVASVARMTMKGFSSSLMKNSASCHHKASITCALNISPPTFLPPTAHPLHSSLRTI